MAAFRLLYLYLKKMYQFDFVGEKRSWHWLPQAVKASRASCIGSDRPIVVEAAVRRAMSSAYARVNTDG